MSAEIAVESLEKSRVSVFTPWIVCFSASLFFFFEFMQVNMFNAITPGLMQTFHIQAIEIAHLSANYFYANVLFLFAAGMVLDRVSTRKLIITAMLANVFGTLCFGLATAVWQAMLCRFITGIAGSFCLLSCVRLASRWFPPRRMALVVGLIVTFAMSGGMVAQTPFTLVVDAVGWRNTLLIDAAVGAIMLLVILMNVRDFPPGVAEQIRHQHRALNEMGFWPALKRVVRNRQTWLGGLYTSLMNLPIFLLGALWGSLYLVQVRHLTRLDASWVTSMLFVGTIIGSPVLGWISDRIALRRLPMILGAVIALALMIWLMLDNHLSLLMLMTLFFGIGFITSTQIISYPLIAESNPHFLIGGAEGMASTLIMAGGFMQAVFAWLMTWHWDHRLENNIPIYSPHDYTCALTIMPIAFCLALLASLLIRETHCRRNLDENTH